MADSAETIRNVRESSWLDEDEQAALDALVEERERFHAALLKIETCSDVNVAQLTAYRALRNDPDA